jgi:glycosyltransferase involved in cell wall biosynthesis
VAGLGLDRLRLVREDRPGKGRVLTAAFRASRGRIVGFLDADMEIPVRTFLPLLKAVRGGAHVAIAVKDSAAPRPWARRLLSSTYNRAVGLLLGSQLTDHQAGCKLFQGPALRALLSEGKDPSPGWLWDTEVLVRLQRRGARIHSVPFSPEATRPSRLGMTNVARAGGDLLGLWQRLSTEAEIEPLKLPSPIDAPSPRA